MTGIIHIVRHGHGVHNINNDNSIHDPDLTTEGIIQSGTLRQTFQHPDTVGIVLTSPLRRSIHTALIAFPEVLHEHYYRPVPDGGGVAGGVELVLDPYLQESDDVPCNTGSGANRLRQQWPNLGFSALVDPWPVKQDQFSPSPAGVKKRAEHVRNDLKIRLDQLAGNAARREVVVVTHSGFAQDIVEDWTLSLAFTESRGYTFEVDAQGQPTLPLKLVPA